MDYITLFFFPVLTVYYVIGLIFAFFHVGAFRDAGRLCRNPALCLSFLLWPVLFTKPTDHENTKTSDNQS